MSEQVIVEDLTGVTNVLPPKADGASQSGVPRSQGGSGAPLPGPMSLRMALKVVGGYTGSITSPLTGNAYPVDLSAYNGRDLDTTWISIMIKPTDAATLAAYINAKQPG